MQFLANAASTVSSVLFDEVKPEGEDRSSDGTDEHSDADKDGSLSQSSPHLGVGAQEETFLDKGKPIPIPTEMNGSAETGASSATATATAITNAQSQEQQAVSTHLTSTTHHSNESINDGPTSAAASTVTSTSSTTAVGGAPMGIAGRTRDSSTSSMSSLNSSFDSMGFSPQAATTSSLNSSPCSPSILLNPLPCPNPTSEKTNWMREGLKGLRNRTGSQSGVGTVLVGHYPSAPPPHFLADNPEYFQHKVEGSGPGSGFSTVGGRGPSPIGRNRERFYDVGGAPIGPRSQSMGSPFQRSYHESINLNGNEVVDRNGRVAPGMVRRASSSALDGLNNSSSDTDCAFRCGSLKFSPLPEGKPRRSNSACIGVASRSQMLGGPAPVGNGGGGQPMTQAQQRAYNRAVRYGTGPQVWYQTGGMVPDDVYTYKDVAKGVGKMWSKLAGGGGTGASGGRKRSTSTTSATSDSSVMSTNTTVTSENDEEAKEMERSQKIGIKGSDIEHIEECDEDEEREEDELYRSSLEVDEGDETFRGGDGGTSSHRRHGEEGGALGLVGLPRSKDHDMKRNGKGTNHDHIEEIIESSRSHKKLHAKGLGEPGTAHGYTVGVDVPLPKTNLKGDGRFTKDSLTTATAA